MVDHFVGILDPEDSRLVRLKLKGYSNMYVAEAMGVCEHTARRRLEEIWVLWHHISSDEDDG